VVNGRSATNAGLLLLPLMAGIIVTSVTSGQVISRTGRYKLFPVGGMLAMTVASYLLYTMGPTTTQLTSSAYMLLLGAGLGATMQVLILAVQNSVQPRDMGTATGAASFVRSMGGAFGVAAFGAILTNRLAANLHDAFPGGLGPGVSTSSLKSSPQVILHLPPEIRTGVIDAFSKSIDAVFLAAVPVAFLGFVLTLFLKEVPLPSGAHTEPVPPPSTSVDEPAADPVGLS
jgi:hypothetical protein